MDSEDAEYLKNYKVDTLYIHPAAKGAYAVLVGENEFIIDEIDITGRSKLAISGFFVNDAKDYSVIKLTKLKFHKTYGWRADGHLQINNFQISKLKEFISILSALDLKDSTKSKISLANIQVEALGAILNSDKGVELLKKIADAPELSEDIFALAHKKSELKIFERLLNEFDAFREDYAGQYQIKQKGEEPIWQNFFERNEWIFGHGLNYQFLHKADRKLEQATTGHSHTTSGNRVDALMHSQAVISQYVLIEIKKPTSNLLNATSYRTGCWTVSQDITNAVSQIQKTVFDFVVNQSYKVRLKDDEGQSTGKEVYRIQPKSYLIIGNLSQLKDNDDKFSCFQLFRHSLTSPEILTYDELFQRAKCIVETISAKNTR